MWVISGTAQQLRRGNRRYRRRRYKCGMGNHGEKPYNKRNIYEQGCAEAILSLARALGRSLGSKDVAFKHVRADFRQGHGSSGHLYGVEIFILVRRQCRIQVGHQRGDSYLITSGVGGLKQVANGFVYKVSADTGDNQSLVCNRDDGMDCHLPACRGLQFGRTVVAALP